MDDKGDGSVRRAALLREFAELENRAMWSCQGQFEQAKSWQSMNTWVGSISAACAAISGALVLAAHGLDIVGGLLALVAAAGGAILTIVNASQRATKATAAANAYLEIQNAARRARRVDVPWIDLQEARNILQSLTERMDEQNKSAEPIAPRAYRRAGKNIRKGGQKATVEELSAND
ncbi:SLATT domain-containing protein [Microbacterium capsulatum]|uniref:SLATT domain-containing protein n=1 Tax=Microbacterium capsulatum TaxID=3041921 RepID=A0ABU0XIU7_9MICO|nr:SLATT domain-containing protein [Microbacterium sp. ASV81]MDQ4215066.1 SLATT domain-containing protein [Microbacterium sp. ASV81]